MKKFLSLLFTFTLLFSLVSCTNADNTNTFVGKVLSVNGNTVKVQLGELSETGGMMFENETPPEKLESQNEAPPEKPNNTEEASPQNNDGSSNDISNGDAPPQGKSGVNFTASEKTAEFDLTNAKIKKESNDEAAECNISDIKTNDILEIILNNKNEVISVTVKFVMPEPGELNNNNFGGSNEVTHGSSASTIDSDGKYENVTYASLGDDENALRIDGSTVTLSNIKIEKSSGATSNTENGDFYGVNAALLAVNSAQLTISESTVNSSAQNGNGIFSYGKDTIVNVSNTIITTTADNSGGIQTTGGGTTNAENLTVETSGNSSAAIRSDRGGGTVNVDGGSYKSNGYNSPAVYSTANITVKNSDLTATNSEALVIEGKNSITLENCTVNGNMSDTKGTSSDENVHNVMIYQSMSGDADIGTSSLIMKNGKLTSNNGDMFFITNTKAKIQLSNVEIENKETNGYLMRISGNSAKHGWGKARSNGAQVELDLSNQKLSGDIIVDSISTLNMTISDESNFTGTVNITENEQKGTAVNDNAVITVEAGAIWNLTGDCKITSLVNNGTINYNGYTLTLADGTVLK